MAGIAKVSSAAGAWTRYRADIPAGYAGLRMRVLVIEDDEVMAQAIASGLRPQRFAVDVALDGSAGLERALLNEYEVVVLDRDLPRLHGDEVCRGIIAGECRSRVLMLTAAASNEDLVEGLGFGADDYLPKPFEFAVLLARIGALARRAHPVVPPVLRHGDVLGRFGAAACVQSGPGAQPHAEGVRGARAAPGKPREVRLSGGAARTCVG
jgi:DNA-binding response OmpR family regulator